MRPAIGPGQSRVASTKGINAGRESAPTSVPDGAPVPTPFLGRLPTVAVRCRGEDACQRMTWELVPGTIERGRPVGADRYLIYLRGHRTYLAAEREVPAGASPGTRGEIACETGPSGRTEAWKGARSARHTESPHTRAHSEWGQYTAPNVELLVVRYV